MSRDPARETALVEAVDEDDDVDGLEAATASAADPLVTAPVLSPTLPRAASLDALAGVSEIKDELRAQIRLWSDPAPLRRLGGVPRIGFIFAGPTGTGKTAAAHALAAETGRDLYTFAGPDFHGSAGRDLLTTVLATMAHQRAVVFVDEADDLLHARDLRRERSDSLVKHLLVGLDRTTREIRSFFVFATNLAPDSIDPALCHPGRLGQPIIFRGLASAERSALLKTQSADYRLADDVDHDAIAGQLGGLPTAALVHVLDEAAFIAARGSHAAITGADLQEAAARLRVGLARSRPWQGAELWRSAVHEAGHAIVRLALGRSWESVAWVEVDARADGSLGAMYPGEHDLGSMTEPQVLDQLAVSMAGRTAEIVVTGSADVASASDLRSANEFALRAVREWGFSDRGPVTSDEYVDAIVEADVDRAVGGLLARAEQRAGEILRRHRPALETLTERLVDHRAGSSRELTAWLAGFDLFADDAEEAR